MSLEKDLVVQAKFIEAIDVSSVDYEAKKDGNGNSIGFSLLVSVGGDLDILPSENAASIVVPVQDGYNPVHLLKVLKNASNAATGVFALYQNKPASVNA